MKTLRAIFIFAILAAATLAGSAADVTFKESGFSPIKRFRDNGDSTFSEVVSVGGVSNATTMLNAATTTGAGTAVKPLSTLRTFQATLSNTTTPAATIVIEGSHDTTNAGWVTLGTITISGASATDGFVSNAPWPNVRARVTAISGTSAAVSVWMGN